MSPPLPASPALRSIGTAAAAVVVAGAAASLLGWILGIYRLTDWWGTGIAIKGNTALALIAVGIALLIALHPPRLRPLQYALALLTVALCALTLTQYFTGTNFGIDTWLFDEAPGAPATSAPGRMGPPAALSLTLLGIALLLLCGGGRARSISVGIALFVLGVAMLSITGYLYGAEAMYTLPRLTGIAGQTAVMLALLAIGVLAADPGREPMKTLCEDSNAGVLARRLLPIAFLVPLTLGWLRLLGLEAGLYDAEFGTALRTLAEIIVLNAMLWWGVRAVRLREKQQRDAETQRQSSERRLIQTLENMADGFVTLDRHWRFSYVNAEAERFLRKSRSELLGRVLWDIYPQMVGTPLQDQFELAAREHVTVEIEGGDFDPGGERYFRNRLYPGAEGGLSVYIQDVTTRKRAEDALREADRLKDEFLATLAHELRNPLAPIRNAATVLMMDGATPQTLQWSAEIIDRQVRHMARLLEDLLDISRISRNRLELRRAPVELAQVIHSAVETSRPAIDEAGHELAVDMPPQPLHIDGDLVRLAQVFSNLLNNAAKYTERGGRIALRATGDAHGISVTVADNGLGIAGESLPQIFDMFTQATPHLPNAKSGLGIGLALARAIVELHGGTIEARSAGPGAGSEFTVRLPLLAQPPAATGAAAGDSPRALPKRRMLVVDDLQDSADSLAALLRSFGHDAQVEYSGQAALARAAALRPAVMFVDIGMPGMDGLAMCRHLRATAWGRQIFIVAVTGWGQAEDRRRTHEAGFDAHLIKPIDFDELIRLLENLPQMSP